MVEAMRGHEAHACVARRCSNAPYVAMHGEMVLDLGYIIT